VSILIPGQSRRAQEVLTVPDNLESIPGVDATEAVLGGEL
jgi:hypothetical protein